MRDKLKIIFVTLAIVSSTVLATVPSHAAVFSGAKCAKKGIVSNSAGKTYTCLKLGNLLIWSAGVSSTKGIPVSTPKPTAKPTPVAVLGSISMPVPAGSPLKIGNLSYTINSVTFNVDPVLCAANGLNSGCKMDDNLNGIVDSASTTSWVAVSFTVQNSGAAIASPAGFSTGFNLVLPSGQLLESERFVFGYPLLSDVRIIPGGSGTGSVMFQVPKSATSLKSFLVIRDSSQGFTSNDYYFQIGW